jgi:uncharacterized membrane protein
MDTTDLIAIIPLALILVMLGIIIGMYITTQIGDWINRQIKKK